MRLSPLNKATYAQLKSTQQISPQQRYGNHQAADNDKSGDKPLTFTPPSINQTAISSIGSHAEQTPDFKGKQEAVANMTAYFDDPKSVYRGIHAQTMGQENPIDQAIHAGLTAYLNGEVATSFPEGPRAWLAQHKKQEAEKENLRVARQQAQVAKNPNGAQKWLLANVDTDGNVISQDRKNANHKWLEERKNRNR